MPRKGDIKFIPSTTNGSGPAKMYNVDQIPPEIIAEVEEIYAALQTNPLGRMRVEFDTVAELNEYTDMVKSWCELRPDGKLRFRKSPTRGLADTVMDFRVTDPKTDPEPAEPASVDLAEVRNRRTKKAAESTVA